MRMTEQAAVISKSEAVRVELTGVEYLKFADLNTRLVFRGQKLNERKSREESMKFALRVTSLAIKHALGEQDDGLFIADDENALIEKIIQKAVSPYIEKDKKVDKLINKLNDINEKTTFTDNDVTITQKDWHNIVNLLSSLKGA
jgi:hypothetical protein